MNKKVMLATIAFFGLAFPAAWEPAFEGKSISPAASGSSIQRRIRTGADEATRAARAGSQKLFQLNIRGEADRAKASELGTLIEDYESFAVIAMTEEQAASASKTGLELSPLETTINLRGQTFEPVVGQAASARTLARRTTNEPGYHLVQFAAPVRDEWLEEIRAAGGEIVQYVPNQAFVVFASPEAMAVIAEHPRVRWTGEFQAGASSTALSNRRQMTVAQGDKGIFDIAVLARTELDKVARASTDFGVTIRNRIMLPNNFFNVLRVEMDSELILPLLQLPGVLAVEPYVKPTREDERSAQILAGNFLNPNELKSPGYDPLAQFGVDGKGVTVAVADDGVSTQSDGGFYLTSANVANAPLRGATAGGDGHGHLNASIIAGDLPFGPLDPLGFNYGLGVARKANILNVPFLRAGYAGTEFDTANDTVNTAGPNGANGFILSNSWGAGVNENAYDLLAAQYDGFVRDASPAETIDPLVIVFSAGNLGAGGLTRPKTAKNVITVASSENLRSQLSPSANSLDDLSDFSSHGPAKDNRIKPDLTAPGTAITGGRAGKDALFGDIDEAHRWSSGSSHAAAHVAGAAALFTQFWKDGHGGANPSPALVKAALINGAREMNGTGTLATVPNNAEGWGRLNLQNVLKTGVPTRYVNQTAVLSKVGEEAAFKGFVAAANRGLRISLAWTDPPAINDPALVNNLDLEVTVGETTYRGNVFTDGVSISGGAADKVNNVENVFLPAGIAANTPVTIRVRAMALNGDGALGNGDPTDQHFALVAFNFSDGLVSSARTVKCDFDGDGRTDLSVWRGAQSNWLIRQSGSGLLVNELWGASYDPYNDIPVPGDYDGDRRTDIAVWRPTNGTWYVVNSATAARTLKLWGAAG
ncbi:MAG TPA: S8 family serine peptidase, partial [Blastocatellia bacterium]|nr:S8 family serine peptidase [Blastocatellia bacterium]